MDGGNKDTASNSKTPTTIRVGLWLSGIYLALILGHVFLLRGGFSEIACLTLNELGDFFAGVFAPLAFSWLVIAVFVQKDELHAQLQEFQRSVDQAERQTDNLERQFALTEKASQKVDISNKFTLIAAECDSIASLFPSAGDEISKSFKQDDFEGAIKAFTLMLQGFNDSQGGLASEWNSVPQVVEDNSDSISHHLQVVIGEIDLVLSWQKINKDNNIQAKIVSSYLRQLRTNADVVIQHIV